MTSRIERGVRQRAKRAAVPLERGGQQAHRDVLNTCQNERNVNPSHKRFYTTSACVRNAGFTLYVHLTRTYHIVNDSYELFTRGLEPCAIPRYSVVNFSKPGFLKSWKSNNLAYLITKVQFFWYPCSPVGQKPRFRKSSILKIQRLLTPRYSVHYSLIRNRKFNRTCPLPRTSRSEADFKLLLQRMAQPDGIEVTNSSLYERPNMETHEIFTAEPAKFSELWTLLRFVALLPCDGSR